MSRFTILITGGCGFLGSHLAEYFLKSGHSVIAVDNFCTGSAANLKFLRGLSTAENSFHFVEADVCSPWAAWIKALPSEVVKNTKMVFHMASPASPPHYQALGLETLWANSLGLKNALEFADSVGARLVFASTSEIYGDPLVNPQPESYRGNVNTVGPRACYDEAKRFGEALMYTHNRKWNTTHGIVRIFNTYGPRMNPQDGRVVINFLVQAHEGSALTIYGSGQQTRSFCYVDDLRDALVEFGKATGEFGPVNIGNPNEFTVRQLAEAVVRLFPNKNLPLEFRELPVDDPTQRRTDISRALSLLNWSPKIQLEEGLRRTYEWLADAL